MRAGKQIETVLFNYVFIRTLNQMKKLRISIMNSVAHGFKFCEIYVFNNQPSVALKSSVITKKIKVFLRVICLFKIR